MDIEDRLVWQPFGLNSDGHDFAIKLEKAFAREMLDTKLNDTKSKRMQETASDVLKRKYNINWTIPYQFESGTAFVSQFNLGSNGIWLATTLDEKRKLTEMRNVDTHIIYHSHNCDATRDVIALQTLVDLWVTYSELLK